MPAPLFTRSQVRVVLESQHLSVCLGTDPGLWWIRGGLLQPIVRKHSTWFAGGWIRGGLLLQPIVRKQTTWFAGGWIWGGSPAAHRPS